MVRQTIAFCGLVALAAAYSTQTSETQTRRPAPTALYEGARLIPGDGSAPIENSAFLVENGMITKVGRKGDVTVPTGAARVDLTGKTVMPTLFETHGHPGLQRGLTYGVDNYNGETIKNDLHRLLYFGVGAVQSLGLEIGTVMDQVRADQEAGHLGGARVRISGRGISSRPALVGNGDPAYHGIYVYELTTEAQARQAVQELTAKKVNMIKIHVRDRGGLVPKLPPNVYRVVIAEAHKRDLRVNAHVDYHADMVDLVSAGIDGFAHLARDKELDDALVASIVRRNVYITPTISGRGTYMGLPPWLQEGASLLKLMQESVPAPVIERIKKSFEGRDPAAVARARVQDAILQRSVAKLAKANARVVVGTDAGLPDNLLGPTVHRELDNLVKAGMTPMQAIVAATSRAAEFMQLDKMGLLAPGREADFVVLDANPLDEITNTQRIASVYMKGVEVDRPALASSLRTH